MSTQQKQTFSVLTGVPESLRNPLVEEFNKIARNYRENRWEPAALNGGKFCEVAYSILHGYVSGAFPAAPSKPANMVDACNALAKAGAFPRSVRIQIPRMLIALYEIRNQRNVGHVGSDVNPNRMDAAVVLAMAKWILAELIRIFHGVDTEKAEQEVERITDRSVPIVWNAEKFMRVLGNFTAREKMMIALYSRHNSMSVNELLQATDYTNSSRFRSNILESAHREGLIHFDRTTDQVDISPLGVRFVENNLELEL